MSTMMLLAFLQWLELLFHFFFSWRCHSILEFSIFFMHTAAEKVNSTALVFFFWSRNTRKNLQVELFVSAFLVF